MARAASDQRLSIWRRTSDDGYDRQRVGLEIETFDEMPTGIASNSQHRRYFYTSQKGKSAAGHEFPDKLSEAEKRAVLEYLKTL